MTGHASKLDAALDELRQQIEALVREEQLRDQLTRLPNGLALSELLKTAVERGDPFWCALVEVDYFKRINDRFTYAVADGLLQKIAKRLGSFDDYVSGVTPARAHGDEFYLFGTGDACKGEHIHQSLDQLRTEIAAMRVPTARGEMSCTVSVGWMSSDAGGDTVLTERAVLRMVEAAVGAAKVRGRNQVVRYSPEVEKSQRRSVRDDCTESRASFTVEVPLDSAHSGDLHCPNCGALRPRPAGP